MEIDFDKHFFFNVQAMRITFSHPDVPRDFRWVAKFICMHGLFTAVFLVAFYNIFYHDLKTMDFNRLCSNSIFAVIYVVITAEWIIMLLHQKTLKKIIAIMMIDFEDYKQLNKEHQAIVLEYADRGKRITRQWIVLVIIGVAAYTLKSILLTIYYAVTDEFRLFPHIYLEYPDIIERNMDNIFVFVFIVYIPQIFYSCYCSAMYVGFVPLGPMFMLHACGQLEILRVRIERLFEGRSSDEAKDELRSIAKRLQFIYSFSEDIQACFKVIYELSMKGSTVMMPISLYATIEALHRREVSIELLIFLFGSGLISSTPCYCSDLLMEKGEKVRMALYMCGWERDYDRSIRSTLIIMMTRALHPTGIRTMFRTVCLDALTDLFQQAYALFNLMNAMWD